MTDANSLTPQLKTESASVLNPDTLIAPTAHPDKSIAPTAQKDRILTLDALRGFALLGVLITNLLQAYSFTRTGADENVSLFIHTFTEGSFVSMFSFLFGLGFALQLRKGEAALSKFRRRVGILLAIGLVHMLLIWAGDILFTYAVLGFVLVYFRKHDDKRLLISAFCMWAFVTAIILLSGESLAPKVKPPAAYLPGDSSYLVTALDRLKDFPSELLNILFAGPFILALFILGYLIGRRGVRNVLADKPFLRSVALVAALIAAPITLWRLGVLNVFEDSNVLYGLEYILASPALGIMYLALLSLFAKPLWGILKLFVPVGQMALTNYLGQSIICTTLFYRYALGLYGGEPGAFQAFLIGLVIFALQTLFSWLWLRAFRFGPAEWVWRSLTYGELQPLRRPSKDTAPQMAHS